ncbi:MAG: DNA polymerase Y family protein [Actinobacteria bacterium]|nr:DNA polymerase Y family protein [Actinomycetota bacterium]
MFDRLEICRVLPAREQVVEMRAVQCSMYQGFKWRAMGRTLCVWFPDWSLRRPDVPSERSCVVIDDGSRVVAANDVAMQKGVEVGMRRSEAEVLCPGGVTLEQDPGAEAAIFEPVVAAIEALVPRVEIAEPGLAFVSIDGAVRYYGGEEAVLAEIVAAVEPVAPGGRFGLAGGPFAARWAAATTPGRIVTDDTAFLAGLDVGTLKMDDLVATFRRLGVGTLGDLARLPRAAVLSRFGNIGTAAHRLAAGEDRAPVPREIPQDLAVEMRFEEPLLLVEQVGFAARTLAHRLMGVLAARGVAPHRIEISVAAADGTERHRVWRSRDPFDASALTERTWWQLRAWIEAAGIPGGVVRMRITPTDLSGEGRALTLFENIAARIEAERAIARVQALVGPDAVLQATPRGGRSLSQRVLWRRWGENRSRAPRDEAPWRGATPAPSPALVVPDPRPVEIEWDAGMPVRVRLRSRWENVLSWAGPWRVTGRWWAGEAAVNRYQVVTSAGALLCDVREGKSYVAGLYD